MHSALIQNRQCRALALHARNVAIWTKSREKIYIKKSNAVHHLSFGVEFTGDTSVLILGTFRETE